MDEKQYTQTSLQMRETFNRLAAGWDAHSNKSPEKLQAIVTLAGLQSGAKVADIACGTGIMLPALLACEPAEVLGIDLSEQMIAIARNKCSDSRVRFMVADLFDLTEQGFDAAYIYNAYPHFPDKAKLVRHINGMLKPGGRLVIAHGSGKERVNGVHNGKTVSPISWTLRSASEEAAGLRDYFMVDILVDTAQMYILSGVKIG